MVRGLVVLRVKSQRIITFKRHRLESTALILDNLLGSFIPTRIVGAKIYRGAAKVSHESYKLTEYLRSERPFSKSQVDRLGEFYAGKRSSPPACHEEIIAWYEWLKAQTLNLVSFAIASQERDGQGPFEIAQSSRVKTKSSIADKVNRGARLSTMQDFAGVRFDVGATHSALLKIASTIESLAKQAYATVRIRNYLTSPQRGYRAVHVWITSETAGRAEIQLRTQLQAEWANTFEKLADLTGRRIRYEDDYQPSDPYLRATLANLLGLSESFYVSEAHLEKGFNAAQINMQAINTTARAIPVDPLVHRERAKIFKTMARYEETLANTAETNIGSLKMLRQTQDILARYPHGKGAEL